ncbi:MAG: hypothetical protein ACI4MN_00025 [Candidatus Coproplasma sp.]
MNRRRMLLAGGKVAPLDIFRQGSGFINGKIISKATSAFGDVFTVSNDSIKMQTIAGANSPAAIIADGNGNPVDFTPYKILHFTALNAEYLTSSTHRVAAFGYTTNSAYTGLSYASSAFSGFTAYQSLTNTAIKEFTLDISSVNGSYYFGIKQGSAGSTVYIYDIWLE